LRVAPHARCLMPPGVSRIENLFLFLSELSTEWTVSFFFLVIFSIIIINRVLCCFSFSHKNRVTIRDVVVLAFDVTLAPLLHHCLMQRLAAKSARSVAIRCSCMAICVTCVRRSSTRSSAW
jgi:hypothetical protein